MLRTFGRLVLLAYCVGTIPLSFAAEDKRTIRELYVPFDSLHVLLNEKNHHVVLDREKYEDLLRNTAPKEEVKNPPVTGAIVQSDFESQFRKGTADINGKLTIENLLEETVWTPIRFSAVSILEAKMDGKPAILAKDPSGQLLVLVQGKGLHELEIRARVTLASDSITQTLAINLPESARRNLNARLEGDVELKAGPAVVVSRKVDLAAPADKNSTESTKTTTFELALTPGPTNLTFSLNNRTKRTDRVAVSRGVLIAEVTEAYERLHATVTVTPLRGEVERVRMIVPNGFEVEQVDAAFARQWTVSNEGKDRSLDIALLEAKAEPVVVGVTMHRSVPSGERWSFPAFHTLDVDGEVYAVATLLEDTLGLTEFSTTNLAPIDVTLLTAAIPPKLLQSNMESAPLRGIAAYFASSDQYNWSVGFRKQTGELVVGSQWAYSFDEAGGRLKGTSLLTPSRQNLHAAKVVMPTRWQVSDWKRKDGRPLTIEKRELNKTSTEYEVQFGDAIPDEGEVEVSFIAQVAEPYLPEGAGVTPIELELPQWADATRHSGIVSLEAGQGYRLSTSVQPKLNPLPPRSRSFEQDTQAFEFQQTPESIRLTLERVASRINTEAVSLFQVRRAELLARYEMVYRIDDADSRELMFRLPAESPSEIHITGTPVPVKEFRSSTEGDSRVWRVILAKPTRGEERLQIHFTQPREWLKEKAAQLPILSSMGSSYESGVVAIEGDNELDLQIETQLESADVGELAVSQLNTGRNLVGVYRFTQPAPKVAVQVTPRKLEAAAAVVVDKLELTTVLALTGSALTKCELQLRSKLDQVELVLPQGTELWSLSIGGAPAQPLARSGRLAVELPRHFVDSPIEVVVIYRSPFELSGLASSRQFTAPKLVAPGSASDDETPTVEAKWTVLSPRSLKLAPLASSMSVERLPIRNDRWTRFFGELFAIVHTGVVERGPPGAEKMPMSSPEEIQRAMEDSLQYLPRDDGNMGQSDDSPYQIFDDVEYDAERQSAVSGEPKTESRMLEQMKKMKSMMSAMKATPSPEGPREEDFARPNAPMANQPNVPAPATPAASAPRKPAVKLREVGSVAVQLEVTPGYETLRFQSLGDHPEVQLLVARTSHWKWLISVVAASVFAVAVGLSRASFATKVAFLTLCVVIGFVTPWGFPSLERWTEPFDGLVVGTAFSLIWFLIFAIFSNFATIYKKLQTSMVESGRAVAPSFLIVAILGAGFSPNGSAQTPEPPASVSYEEDKGEKTPPIPMDAIVIPYDPADPNGTTKAARVMVPFAKYEELVRIMEGKPAPKAEPVTFAWTSAELKSELGNDDTLLIRGAAELRVASRDAVLVPFGADQLAFVSLEIDGKPAPIQAIVPAPSEGIAGAAPVAAMVIEGQASNSPTDPIIPRTFKVSFTLRASILREGGWRHAQGKFPAIPAALWRVTAPESGTQFRIEGLIGPATYETKSPGEAIDLGIATNQVFHLRWRPKLELDHSQASLAVRSNVAYDVRDDGFRVIWNAELEFRRGRYSRFSFRTPKDFTIDAVTGASIRSWNATEDGDQRRVEVELLAEITDRERVTVELSRRGAVGIDTMQSLGSPVVVFDDAVVQQGNILVRGSPRLDIQIVRATRLDRTEVSGLVPLVAAIDNDPARQSFLPLKPIQAFRFSSTGYQLDLMTSVIPEKREADAHVALRRREGSLGLEAEITIRDANQPIHKVEMFLPDQLKDMFLDSEQKSLEWFERLEGGRRLLTLVVGDATNSGVTIRLSGTIEPTGDAKTYRIPGIEVRGARQQTELAIICEETYDARTSELEGMEIVAPRSLAPWLAPALLQQTRLALRSRTDRYRGGLSLERRAPTAATRSYYNFRVTKRALEETLLFDLTPGPGGVDRFSVLLPERMRGANIRAPGIRNIGWETSAADARIPEGFVRMLITPQTPIVSNWRVLVELDLPLQAKIPPLELAIIETGETTRRFLTLEGAGRDEITAQDVLGLERVAPNTSAWNELVAVFRTDPTLAFVATGEGRGPKLTAASQTRSAVATVGARIGWLDSKIVVDESGAYRAKLLFYMENRDEPLVDVELPDGARFWGAIVDGIAVKPVAPANNQSKQTVRIPILKSAEGEGEYLVEISYSGKLTSFSYWGNLTAPIGRVLNIGVESSHVSLHVPDNFSYLRFAGDFGDPQPDENLDEEYQRYLNRKILSCAQSLQSEDTFVRIRAEQELAELKQQLDATRGYVRGRQANEAYAGNSSLIQDTERAGAIRNEVKNSQEQNRDKLSSYFGSQASSFLRSLSLGKEEAFQRKAEAQKPQSRAGEAGFQNFLANNGLEKVEQNRDQAASNRRNPMDRSQSGKKGKLAIDKWLEGDEKRLKQETVQDAKNAGGRALGNVLQNANRYRLQVQGQGRDMGGGGGGQVPQQAQIEPGFGGMDGGAPLSQANDRDALAYVVPTGMASLTTPLAERGVRLRFTSARQGASLSFWHLNASLLQRTLPALGGLLAMAILLFGLSRAKSRNWPVVWQVVLLVTIGVFAAFGMFVGFLGMLMLLIILAVATQLGTMANFKTNW